MKSGSHQLVGKYRNRKTADSILLTSRGVPRASFVNNWGLFITLSLVAHREVAEIPVSVGSLYLNLLRGYLLLITTECDAGYEPRYIGMEEGGTSHPPRITANPLLPGHHSRSAFNVFTRTIYL